MPDPAALLLAALLGAEVAAVGLAVVQFWRARDPSEPRAPIYFRFKARAVVQFWRTLRAIEPRPRAILLLLTFALADEALQLLLHAWLDTAPRPLAGLARAGWHASIALSLGWPAVLAWAAQTRTPRVIKLGASGVAVEPSHIPGGTTPLAFVGRTPHAFNDSAKMAHERSIVNLLLGGYVGLLAGLAVVYPPSRAGLRWTLLVWELACVAVAWWGIARRWGRTWGAVEHVLVVLVSCETMVCVVGPFASDPFTRWWIARCFYLGAWGAICGVLIKRRD